MDRGGPGIAGGGAAALAGALGQRGRGGARADAGGAGHVFGLHRLALEDVSNVPQRPKAEWYDEHLFVVGRMIRLIPALDVEQLSMFLGSGYVLTFQERAGDPLDPVRRRLQGPPGRIRAVGADYLAYAILDAVTDHYFPVLESYGDELEALEDCILAGTGRLAMARLHAVKRDLLTLRKSIWPVRDAITALLRDPGELIGEGTQVYLRDCHDHVVQAAELVETYRELAASLTDLYLSSVSYRMNEIMKVLTIFTAVFIPLSFIAGLYGMNFDRSESPLNMPELEWYFGYPFALGLMAVIALGLLYYFWRRGWIGSRETRSWIRTRREGFAWWRAAAEPGGNTPPVSSRSGPPLAETALPRVSPPPPQPAPPHHRRTTLREAERPCAPVKEAGSFAGLHARVVCLPWEWWRVGGVPASPVRAGVAASPSPAGAR